MTNRTKAGFGDVAAIYRAAGWLGVLPVDLGEPGVVPRGFTGRNGSSPDDAQVQQWAAMYPTNNVGLRLPEDVIGIDVDCYDGKTGCDTLLWWEFDQNAGELPPTWFSTARDDGSRIMLYRVPTGRRWITELPEGGVELIQFGHRWARVWPSTNPKTGQPYRWFAPDGTASDRPPKPSELATLPDAWVNALSSRNSDGEHKPSAIAGVSTSDLLRGVPQGERHNRILSAVGRWWNQLGDEEAVRVLALTMARNCEPPHDEADVLRIVQDICAKPRGSLDPDLLAWARGEDEKRPRLVAGGDFALDEPEQIPAIWGDGELVLASEGEPFMIAAPQGTGKTTITQQLVLHRIGVRPGKLLGLSVAPLASDRKVLYLAMDRPRQAARSQRRMLSEDEREAVNARVLVWRGPLPFDPVKNTKALANWVEKLDPNIGCVVVDSVKDLAPGIVQDEVASALNNGWQELIARGVELSLLHHHRKAAQGKAAPHTLDDVYGSVWLTAGCGSVVTLMGEPSDPVVELKHLKIPAAPVGPLTVQHDHPSGTSRTRDVRVSVHDVLREHGTQGATVAEIAHLVHGRASSKETKRVERELKKLREQGTVKGVPGTYTSEGKQPTVWRLIEFLQER